MKYKKGDICIVYEGSPTYEDGGVVQIIDRDLEDQSYVVALLQEVGMCNMNVMDILKNHAKWVKEENLELVSYKKPAPRKESLLKRISKWIANLKVGLSRR